MKEDKPKVVNIKSLPKGWRENPCYVYIGRPSTFGNPFVLKEGEPKGSTLTKFREYAVNRITRDPAFKEAVKALAGKTLVCFCAPGPCHGEVLAELAVTLTEESTKP